MPIREIIVPVFQETTNEKIPRYVKIFQCTLCQRISNLKGDDFPDSCGCEPCVTCGQGWDTKEHALNDASRIMYDGGPFKGHPWTPERRSKARRKGPEPSVLPSDDACPTCCSTDKRRPEGVCKTGDLDRWHWTWKGQPPPTSACPNCKSTKRDYRLYAEGATCLNPWHGDMCPRCRSDKPGVLLPDCHLGVGGPGPHPFHGDRTDQRGTGYA